MSDIVERLNRGEGCLEEGGKTCISMDAESGCLCAIAADEITRLRADIINYKIGNKDLQDHCAEMEQTAIDLEEYRRDVERLRAALRECEAELNAYYRMEYPGDHPHSQKELAQAMASNPATVALSGVQALINPEQIPDEVVEAFVDAYYTKDMTRKAAISAAIAAWPGMEIHTDGTEDWIELTLTQENNND